MSFKDISYLELWQPHCLVERNHLCNFGRRHHKMSYLKDFLSSLQWSRTIYAILVEGIKGTTHCEIILELDWWFRRYCLKIKLTDGQMEGHTQTKTDHNNISKGIFILSSGSCSRGGTWGCLGVKKGLFPNMVMWHIKFKGMVSRTGHK